MSKALLSKSDDGTEPRLLLNTDMSTLMLDADGGYVWASSKLLKALKRNRKGVGKVGAEVKGRAAGCLVTTSASGDLVCTIIVIKDSIFKELSWHGVSDVICCICMCFSRRMLIHGSWMTTRTFTSFLSRPVRIT